VLDFAVALITASRLLAVAAEAERADVRWAQ
jgi:hypothetical protein